MGSLLGDGIYLLEFMFTMGALGWAIVPLLSKTQDIETHLGVDDSGPLIS